MKINKTSWVLLGIFLWGLPTGIFLAMMLSIMKSSSINEMQSFEMSIFFKYAIITVPIFAIAGVCYGLYMHGLGFGHKRRDIKNPE